MLLHMLMSLPITTGATPLPESCLRVTGAGGIEPFLLLLFHQSLAVQQAALHLSMIWEQSRAGLMCLATVSLPILIARDRAKHRSLSMY